MTGREIQILVGGIISVLVGVFIYRSAQQGRMSFKYAVGWLSVCAIGVFFSLITPIIGPIANLLDVTPAALLSVATLVLLLLLCIQLSISISGLQERVRSLVERLSQLESERPHD